MIRPESPCLDCEVRVAGCHAFCPMYREYTEKQTEYRQLVKKNRWESYGTRVEWPNYRLKMNRKEKK